MTKFYTLTLESDSHTFLDFLEDYPGIDPIFSVEVDDVLDGAEIYKAVEEKYSNVVDKKDINFITNQFLTNEDATFVAN